MESRIRASHEQFSLLLKFMERHGDLSRPVSGVQGRLRADQLWLELANLLNAVGERGVNKSSDKWKRVWSDWKTKTKKKAALINRDNHSTGRDPSKGKPLTPLEKRILRVMRMNSTPGQESFEVPLQLHPKVERISSSDGTELMPSILASTDTTASEVQGDFLPVCNEADRVGTPDPLSLTTPVLDPSNSRTRDDSPVSKCTRPRQRKHRPRLFIRATSDFISIEQSRMRLENERLKLDRERVKLERERIRVEGERVKVEAERIRVEQGRMENERILRETIFEFNNNVTGLLMRWAPLFDVNLNQ